MNVPQCSKVIVFCSVGSPLKVINPSRCVLLLLLVVAAGGVSLLENPISTLLNAHNRFQHLVRLLHNRGIGTLSEKGEFSTKQFPLGLGSVLGTLGSSLRFGTQSIYPIVVPKRKPDL